MASRVRGGKNRTPTSYRGALTTLIPFSNLIIHQLSLASKLAGMPSSPMILLEGQKLCREHLIFTGLPFPSSPVQETPLPLSKPQQIQLFSEAFPASITFPLYQPQAPHPHACQVKKLDEIKRNACSLGCKGSQKIMIADTELQRTRLQLLQWDVLSLTLVSLRVKYAPKWAQSEGFSHENSVDNGLGVHIGRE